MAIVRYGIDNALDVLTCCVQSLDEDMQLLTSATNNITDSISKEDVQLKLPAVKSHAAWMLIKVREPSNSSATH